MFYEIFYQTFKSEFFEAFSSNEKCKILRIIFINSSLDDHKKVEKERDWEPENFLNLIRTFSTER